MSFNMSNGVSRGSFRGYDSQNDYGSNMSYQEEYKPQIYRVRRFDQLFSSHVPSQLTVSNL
jgi:hypothetical protein